MRDDKGRFLTGTSGNLSGRPKVVGELKELASVHTPQAIETLANIMTDKEAPHAARVAASTALLDRVYGRPSQNVEARIELDIASSHAAVLMRLADEARLAKLSEKQKMLELTAS